MVTYKRLGYMAAIAVSKLLETHMTKDGDFGIYNPGYNDGRIALMATTADIVVNENQVGNIRREMFGNFPPSDKQLTSRLEARVEDLEGRLKAVELLLQGLVNPTPKPVRDPLGDKNFPTASGDVSKLRIERRPV